MNGGGSLGLMAAIFASACVDGLSAGGCVTAFDAATSLAGMIGLARGSGTALRTGFSAESCGVGFWRGTGTLAVGDGARGVAFCFAAAGVLRGVFLRFAAAGLQFLKSKVRHKSRSNSCMARLKSSFTPA